MKNRSRYLPLKNKLCYGIGSLGYSSLSQTMHSFIMFFATSVMGLSGFLTGVAISIASLWDGVSDPLVGNLSDNSQNRRFGKRLGFMFVASFVISFFNIFLWSMPRGGQAFMFLWLLVFMLLQESANTFFGTPNAALGLDLAKDYNEQSKIQSFRSVFNIFGMLLPTILLYFLMPASQVEGKSDYTQSGFVYIAIINSLLMIFFAMISVFGNLKRVRQQSDFKNTNPKKFSLNQMLKGYVSIFKKPAFSTVIFGYAFSQMASIFLTSIGMHLFTYCYHFTSTQISLLLLCLFAGAILSQPLWLKISKKIDKKPTVIIALSVILLGLSATLITFLFRTYISIEIIYYFVCATIFICGFGTGALYSLPISMYADVISLEEFKNKESKTGEFLGCYSFTYNLSNSISLLIMGTLLDIIKFNSSEPVQALSVQSGLGVVLFCGCGIALAISIAIFSRYKIKRSDVLKTQIKIQKINFDTEKQNLCNEYYENLKKNNNFVKKNKKI